jgi:hypothetical protein
MHGINAGTGEDQAGERKRAGIGRPSLVALVGDVAHAIGARDRVDHDVEPQPDEQPAAHREHPEPRQHAHHGEHEQGVGDDHQNKERHAAAGLPEIKVAEPGR